MNLDRLSSWGWVTSKQCETNHGPQPVARLAEHRQDLISTE